MGREIRKVPPNWVHPKNKNGHDQPMYDKTFEQAAQEWKDEFAAWERGERPSYGGESSRTLEFWEYNGPPPDDRAYYRPWKDEEATWFQVWQTVSEGSPVSPPFATMDELIQHLADHGDDWDDGKGWGISRAKAFCEDGYAPSWVVVGNAVMKGTEFSLYAKEHPAPEPSSYPSNMGTKP
jgi:hypothetical protein